MNSLDYLEGQGNDDLGLVEATTEVVEYQSSSGFSSLIAHDLSRLKSTDFVHVLNGGRIIEQSCGGDSKNPGCREDRDSEFCTMLETQMQTGEYVPQKP